MAKPKLKMETEILRFAVESFDLCTTTAVDLQMENLGISLIDLHDSITDCVATGINNIEAQGTIFGAVGSTMEGTLLDLDIWMDPNIGSMRVERVSSASGESGDVDFMQKNEIGECAGEPQ